MLPSAADLRIFSYLPNPRVLKATIAARLSGVNVELVGAPAGELVHWLWDFDARPMNDADRDAMQGLQVPARRGLANEMVHKTEAFLNTHPFGTVPAGFSPDGTTGIFESNSIMRLVARLAVGPVHLLGNGPYESSRVDSFLDSSLTFSHDVQRYILALRSGQIDVQVHGWAIKALDGYLSGIERTLKPDRSYLVGNVMTVADICFVCDLAPLANERLHESVLSRAGLEAIARPELVSIYPLAFQHFSKLCRDPAFEPDVATYRDKLGVAPFTQPQPRSQGVRPGCSLRGNPMTFVHLEFDGAVATVTLDHPAGNRINFQMREEILDAFERVAASQARVLLIKGKGTDFCLGGDIRDWPGIPSSELRPKVEVFAKAIDLLEKLPIPTIAVVQGGCMGGGFELALGCDLVIAGASARFRFPEAMLGIMTLQGGVYQLAERIGRNKAIELVYLSEPVGADRMAEWNVVNRVVDDAVLDEEANGLAQRLAAGSSQVHAGTKALLRTWRLQGRAAARGALYEMSMPLFDTPEVQSALSQAVEAVNAGRPIPSATFPNEKA